MQEVLVCVSLFGQYDSQMPGDFYCNGNAFASDTGDLFGNSITIGDKVVPRTEALEEQPGGATFDLYQNWTNGGDTPGWGEAVTPV
jgi:hypothetical protein